MCETYLWSIVKDNVEKTTHEL